MTAEAPSTRAPEEHDDMIDPLAAPPVPPVPPATGFGG